MVVEYKFELMVRLLGLNPNSVQNCLPQLTGIVRWALGRSFGQFCFTCI